MMVADLERCTVCGETFTRGYLKRWHEPCPVAGKANSDTCREPGCDVPATVYWAIDGLFWCSDHEPEANWDPYLDGGLDES